MKQSQSVPTNHLWRLFYPILTYMAIYTFVELLGTTLGMAQVVVSIKKSGGSLEYYSLLEQIMILMDRYALEMNMAAFLLGIPVEMIYYRKDAALWRETQPVYEKPGKAFYLVLPVLGAAGCFAINNMLNISGLFRVYKEQADEVAGILYTGRIAVEILGTVILAALLEELIFRGIIQQRIRSFAGPVPAVIASAVLFGCYHGNTIQMIYAGLLGVLIAYSYEKFHSLPAAFLVHAGANLISVLGSETGCFDFLYGDDTRLLVGTGVWCGVIFLCIYLIHTFVNPAVVNREGGAQPEEQKPGIR